MIAVELFVAGLLLGLLMLLAAAALRLRRKLDQTQAELDETRAELEATHQTVEQLHRENSNHVSSLTLLLEQDAKATSS